MQVLACGIGRQALALQKKSQQLQRTEGALLLRVNMLMFIEVAHFWFGGCGMLLDGLLTQHTDNRPKE